MRRRPIGHLHPRFQPPREYSRPTLAGVVSDRFQQQRSGTESKKARHQGPAPNRGPAPAAAHASASWALRPGRYPCCRGGRPAPVPAPAASPPQSAPHGRPIGHAEQTHAFPMIFRYLHAPHRTREIAPRAHPVPQLEQIVPQLLCEQADADRVHARRPVIGPDLLPRLHDEALTRSQTTSPSARAWPSAPPLAGWPRADPGLHGPFAPAPLQDLHRYYEPSRPCAPPRYSATRGVHRLRSSLSRPAGQLRSFSPGRRYRGDRFSCSMPAPATSSRHLYTGHRQGSTQATPWLRARSPAPLSRGFGDPPVLMPSFRLSMRQQWFTHVRLLVAHLTR